MSKLGEQLRDPGTWLALFPERLVVWLLGPRAAWVWSQEYAAKLEQRRRRWKAR